MKRVIRKLKKLIAHERSARQIGSTAEAEAFARRIHQWLIENKLSMQEVELAEESREEVDGTVLQPTKRSPWRECLAGEIATSYFCEAIVRVDGSYFSIVIIGAKPDREVVVELLQYFNHLALELAGRETAKYRDQLRTVKSGASLGAGTRRFKASFLIGFSAAVCLRFQESRKQVAESMSLVRSDEKLREYMKRIELEEYQQPRVPDLGAAGFYAGLDKGSRVALTSKTLAAS